MTVNNQILERMMAATAAGTQYASAPTGSESTEEPSQFESMIRQRASQTDSAQPKEQNEAPTVTDKQTDDKPPVDEEPSQMQELAATLVTAQPVVSVDLTAQPTQSATAALEANLSVQTVTDASAQLSQTVAANAQTEATAGVPLEIAATAKYGSEASAKLPTGQTEAQPQNAAAQQSAVTQQVSSTVMQVQPQNSGQSSQNTDDNGSQLGQTAVQEAGAKTKETETPLFENVEAVPVKVAQPQTDTSAKPVLELTQTDAAQKLASQVETAIDQGSSKLEVKLSPENLGDMTVEITRASDGSLGVVLKTSTDRAASILSQCSSNLQNLLAASTQSQVKIEVQAQSSQQSLTQFLNPDGSNGRGGQQSQQQQQPHEKEQTQDFIAQLRLGLIDLNKPA